MRILVIGGTRFIGVYVVAQLSAMGHEVTIFHRGQSEANELQEIEHIHGDREELAKFTDEFKRLSPDVVLDMSLANEAQTRKVVNAVRGFADRIVAPSSMDVYYSFGLLNGTELGPPQETPITEEGKLRSNLYPYRKIIPEPWAQKYDKILVEKVLMGDEKVDGTVLRLPVVYGPLDYQHRLFYWLKAMVLDRRNSILLGEKKANERGPSGYVENIARGIVLAATSDAARKRIYNVCEPESLSMLEQGRAVAKVVKWGGKIITGPDKVLPEGLRGTGIDWTVDSTKIRRELGYKEIVPFEEGLRKTIDWELKNPPAKPADYQLIDYSLEDKLLDDLQVRS